MPMQIFDRRQYELLKQSQRELHDLLPEIDKAEDCGVECAGFKQIARRLSEQLEAYERHFMRELRE